MLVWGGCHYLLTNYLVSFVKKKISFFNFFWKKMGQLSNTLKFTKSKSFADFVYYAGNNKTVISTKNQKHPHLSRR